MRLAILDPADQSLWLGTAQGWIHYTPTLERWDEGPLPGTPTAIGVDPADGIGGAWFRIDGRWYRQARIGGATQLATPSRSLQIAPTIDDALRDVPQLRTIAPRLVTGPGLEQGRLTAAAPLSDGATWLLGTSNLVCSSSTGSAPRRRRSPSACAARASARSPCCLTASGSPPTRSCAPLPSWPSCRSISRQHQRRRRTAVRAAVRGSAPDRRLDRALWLATDQGVVRLTLPDRRTTRWNEVNGFARSAHAEPGAASGADGGGHDARPRGGAGRWHAERLAMRFIDPAYARALARRHALGGGAVRVAGMDAG
ncbi:MAG: hypothetical protein IPG05_11375 [Gemmatimonadetes bacterium]|nr:hypothetical protein [Gemmatimonadota bacterium]